MLPNCMLSNSPLPRSDTLRLKAGTDRSFTLEQYQKARNAGASDVSSHVDDHHQDLMDNQLTSRIGVESHLAL